MKMIFFSRVLTCFADIHEVHGKKRWSWL